jgi:type I restriction enzyme, S subunit
VRQARQFRSEFLAFLLNSRIAKIQYGAGLDGAIQQHFNIETAKNLIVVVPPLDEQRSIAQSLSARLSKLARLTAEIQEHIERLNEYRTALISAAVTGKIDVRGEVEAP